MANSAHRETELGDGVDVFEATQELAECDSLLDSLDHALAGLAKRAEAEAAKQGAESATIEPFRKYVGRECDFCVDVLGRRLWAFERRAIESFFSHRYLAVAGGRGVSKTEVLALIVIIAVCTRECIVLTTGPGDRQVKEVLWQRIAKLVAQAREKGAKLPGELQTASWRVGPEHYALGFATGTKANEAGAGRMQGWHTGKVLADDPDEVLTPEEQVKRLEELHAKARATARPLFVLIDEAASVAPAIFHALEGSMSGPVAHQGLFMNPTIEADSPHPAVRAFSSGSTFRRMRATQLREHEDHGDDGDLVYDEVFRAPLGLYDPAWVEKQRREMLEGSPMWCSYVEGRFPLQGVERRFLTKAMLDASAADLLPDSGDPEGRHLGVDIARQGADESVATLWVCGVVAATHSWRSDDLMETADIVLELQREWAPEGKELPDRNVHIDMIGLGAGVLDRLRQLGHYVDGVDVGAAAKYDWKWLTGQMKFANRKAELHWVARRLVQERRAAIPPQYEELRRQACWTRYEFEERVGGTQIAIHREDGKEGLRERHGRSPDQWDSAMLGLSRAGGGKPGLRVVKNLSALRKLRRNYRR